ncbi:MAG: serine hydrolase domain-containing protein [Desulfoplanes sp.]
MNLIQTMMQQAVDEGVFPGGVLLAAREGAVTCFVAAGRANVFSGTMVTHDTLFDLASLTKPLATTLAVMKLVEQGVIEIDQPMGSILPALHHTGKQMITLRQLLAHTSGLPAYQPYYLRLCDFPADGRKAALRQLLGNEPLIHPVGAFSLYSDIGFMLLEWVVETVSGQRLDRYVSDQIYWPLGLDHLFFIDLNRPRPVGRYAATEQCPWRKRVLEGEVHDDNAHAAGGIAGHAGLFGTAEDVFRLLDHLMGIYHQDIGSGIICPQLVRQFFKRQPGTDRALGFDTPSATGSSAGEFFSRCSVGHLGFTGTSFWMDLERSVIVILLTNRVHPSRDNTRISAFRPKVHNAVITAMSGCRR